MSLWLGGLGGYSLCNLTLKKKSPFCPSTTYSFSQTVHLVICLWFQPFIQAPLRFVSPFCFSSPLLSTEIFALSALISFLTLISQFISSSFHSFTCSRLFSFISCSVHSFAKQLLIIFPFTRSLAHLLCFPLTILISPPHLCHYSIRLIYMHTSTLFSLNTKSFSMRVLVQHCINEFPNKCELKTFPVWNIWIFFLVGK